MLDYKTAGVDIEAGYKSVELMKKHVKETMRPEVLGGLGGFAGAFDLSGIKNMEEFERLVQGEDHFKEVRRQARDFFYCKEGQGMVGETLLGILKNIK